MQVELLCNGGFVGVEACIGKQFTTVPDERNKDYIRIAIADLEMAGFINDGSVTTSLMFFNFEVRIID